MISGMQVMKIKTFQLNISKVLPATLKNTGTWDVNTTIVSLTFVFYLVQYSVVLY